MRDPSVPGIYVDEQQYSLNPLRVEVRCLTGFVGITERGPLNIPVHIKSFDEYIKIFGSFDTVGILPYSIYSFFKCGGSECVIVRVANQEEASHAEMRIPCSEGYIELEASSPGKWGNYLTARTWIEGDNAGKINNIDLEKGLWVELDSSDIKVDDTIRITYMGKTFFRNIIKAEDKKIYVNKQINFSENKTEKSEIKIEKVFFSINISCKGKSESYIHLSMNPMSDRYYFKYINDRSMLCRIRKSNCSGIVKQIFSINASGGSDGIADITAGEIIGYYKGPENYKGLGALESRNDISLIAIPDIEWLLSQSGKSEEEKKKDVHAVQLAMLNQALRFSDRFAIFDVPSVYNTCDVASWASKYDSYSCAAYYPAIDIIDPLDTLGSKTVHIPPSGAVCGCIAAADSEKGIFHAPANVIINGAVGVSKRVSEREYEELYPNGINILRYFPGKGIKIWGARTLSSDPQWRYINVRRTFSRISSTIKQGTQWAVFETNDKKLRKRVVRQVSGFLLDLWMEGYLAGNTSEQGFYVRCDEELNPPEQIDKGYLVFEVGIAVIKPAEFFKITITAEKEGASVYIDEP